MLEVRLSMNEPQLLIPRLKWEKLQDMAVVSLIHSLPVNQARYLGAVVHITSHQQHTSADGFQCLRCHWQRQKTTWTALFTSLVVKSFGWMTRKIFHAQSKWSEPSISLVQHSATPHTRSLRRQPPPLHPPGQYLDCCKTPWCLINQSLDWY